MTRTRFGSWILGVALVYGGELQAPVLIQVRVTEWFQFLRATPSRRHQLPDSARRDDSAWSRGEALSRLCRFLGTMDLDATTGDRTSRRIVFIPVNARCAHLACANDHNGFRPRRYADLAGYNPLVRITIQRRAFIAGAVAGASSAGLLGYTSGLFSRRRVPASLPPGAAAAEAQPSRPIEVPAGRESFAQQGEDLILYNLLHDVLKIESPTYLDIGAGDPVQASNTYAFYRAGFRGVLVEPNPTLVARLRTVRPNDVVVPMGVGVTDATAADYYVIRDQWPLNTFSLATVKKLRRESPVDPVEQVIKMPLISINRLIAEHFDRAPDLLSTDIEGLDLAVLQTLDSKRFRPATICAETKDEPGGSHEDTPIAKLLRSLGYIPCAGSLYNTIFVDRSRLG